MPCGRRAGCREIAGTSRERRRRNALFPAADRDELRRQGIIGWAICATGADWSNRNVSRDLESGRIARFMQPARDPFQVSHNHA